MIVVAGFGDRGTRDTKQYSEFFNCLNTAPSVPGVLGVHNSSPQLEWILCTTSFFCQTPNVPSGRDWGESMNYCKVPYVCGGCGWCSLGVRAWVLWVPQVARIVARIWVGSMTLRTRPHAHKHDGSKELWNETLDRVVPMLIECNKHRVECSNACVECNKPYVECSNACVECMSRMRSI